MDFEFYLDLLMIVLLIATIIYAVILNRRLGAFRRNREDMEQFLAAFNAATERAESSIRGLKEMAGQTGDRLREDIERASALNEDLSFMIDRGESIAGRLEKAAAGVNASRKGSDKADGLGAMSSLKPSRADDKDIIDDRVGIETRAEELAARMVRDAEMQTGRSGLGSARSPTGPVSPVGSGYGNVAIEDDEDEDSGRSDAERELLAALRSVR
ncbi:DUF6468 domain-containing protein [Thalassospira sp.]|uniref:DUF6468 domain-containing protein n=1 Tax=Thalassospira sp. TaxID=1912094 RepID=UPI0027367DE4|nr:DUF6468 domain-containing protein [Thalassospira sp.]MDP2696674.1 DUF6468 domain-containing protein [Thalassospira sp.]